MARIRVAIRSGESIVVYGDFDADGVTSTALLVQALKALGAQVTPYIPHRVDEGYGLHNDALDKIAAAGARLVITVDCGIRSPIEVAHGQALGLDMIVTDHHSIQLDDEGRDLLPSALAVINPKQQADHYPFRDFAGVGLAFKLAQALLIAEQREPILPAPPALEERDLLDLVALGTVADLAPLLGENRSLVQRGLAELNQAAPARHPGDAGRSQSGPGQSGCHRHRLRAGTAHQRRGSAEARQPELRPADGPRHADGAAVGRGVGRAESRAPEHDADEGRAGAATDRRRSGRPR